MRREQYFQLYRTTKDGLTRDQLRENRTRYGSNSVTTRKRDGFVHIWLVQLGSFFSVVLFAAAIILYVMGDMMDLYVVLSVVLINSLIETFQRYRSDAIFESLTKIVPHHSVVIRDSKTIKIESSDIVAGDIVLLQAGDRIPADGIVIMAEEMKVDESILTGESRMIPKSVGEEYDSKRIIDNAHVVFSGSHLVSGHGQMLVTHVGNKTQLGMIAQKVTTIDTQLPLYRNIKKLSFAIFGTVLMLATLVFVIGLVQMEPWPEMAKVAVALFVSAIPESLPMMLTLVLACGFRRMSERNVLVRKMQSLDALGQIDTLALDKTGTITHNQMKVEKVFTFDGKELYVTGDGYEPRGAFVSEQSAVSLEELADMQDLVQSAVLSSFGTYSHDKEKGEWILHAGDPTEVALLVLGEKASITKAMMTADYSLTKAIPFKHQNMYHSAEYTQGRKKVVVYTGAPETIFGLATHVRVGGSDRKITDAYEKNFHAKLKEYANAGYRVLATAVKQGDKAVCLGLFALNDSIRSDVFASVSQVQKGGVDIVIITGDHRDVALQIAKKIGLDPHANSVLTGDDMANLTDAQLRSCIGDKMIFARVTPQQKLRILELLRESGRVVAMTGDGINDALALVKADIGIAMGTLSSDSAKEASDIILLDNKFGSIVHGIKEGKTIFANIQKTILFLLSTNFAEMFVIVLAVTLALPLPLSAIGILWLNLVTDTFLVMGFAFERGTGKGHKGSRFLGRNEWKRIVYLGLVMTLVGLFVFIQSLPTGVSYAQSMALLVLVIMQWFNVLNIRAGEKSVFAYKEKINSVFVLGWLVSVTLTVWAFNIEFLRDILNIHPISSADWVYAVFLGSFILWLEEFRKLGRRFRLFSLK